MRSEAKGATELNATFPRFTSPPSSRRSWICWLSIGASKISSSLGCSARIERTQSHLIAPSLSYIPTPRPDFPALHDDLAGAQRARMADLVDGLLERELVLRILLPDLDEVGQPTFPDGIGEPGDLGRRQFQDPARDLDEVEPDRPRLVQERRDPVPVATAYSRRVPPVETSIPSSW